MAKEQQPGGVFGPLTTTQPPQAADPKVAAVAAHKALRATQRAARLQAMSRLAKARGSLVISYITTGRAQFGTTIASDVIRLFRDHLEAIDGKVDLIDLFLVTNGGQSLTPLRLVSLLREFGKRVAVLVPYMAHSAGTLIALGADEIVMGAMGELGPVDPSVTNPFNPVIDPADVGAPKLPTPRPRVPISVEDVTAYLSLASERAKLDPSGMATAFQALTAEVHPLALGNILRNHTLIRHLVRRLLSMHMGSAEGDVAKIESVVETLTEKLHAHDYLITREEAAVIGLKVVTPAEPVERDMWELYKLLERDLTIGQPINALSLLGPESRRYVCVDAGLIESKSAAHAFCFRGTMSRKANEFSFDADGQGWERF